MKNDECIEQKHSFTNYTHLNKYIVDDVIITLTLTPRRC